MKRSDVYTLWFLYFFWFTLAFIGILIGNWTVVACAIILYYLELTIYLARKRR
ncbi:hypothetical protein JDFR1000234_10 [uncultured archaeal virus]|uniref:Uncharacterized protein n=1 Tax=uncultured archaeal virus TaxID=1960247 RepID=A0A1S5Y2Y7_9VIRU|nr:hypothetical protein JDFR1000234_10 [uncultured archaeal virus]